MIINIEHLHNEIIERNRDITFYPASVSKQWFAKGYTNSEGKGKWMNQKVFHRDIQKSALGSEIIERVLILDFFHDIFLQNREIKIVSLPQIIELVYLRAEDIFRLETVLNIGDD